MGEMIDFEELIDLNMSFLSVSQRSSQGPYDAISDVLDKMCEAMDESNLETDNILKNNDSLNKSIHVFNLNRVDETAFAEFEDNETDDSRVTTNKNRQKNKNCKIIPNDDLEEFECILAAKCLEKNCYVPKTNDITTHKEENVKYEIDEIVNDDNIDLEAFEGILGTEFSNNKCVENANNEYHINNTSISNQYEVKNDLNNNAPNDKVIYLDEFERFLANNNLTKRHVEEKNVKIDNSIATSEEHFKIENEEICSDENVIDLDEYLSQDITIGIQTKYYLKNSITGSNLQKYVKTIVPYEIPFEFAVENKNRSETVTEQTHYELLNKEKCVNCDCEDGYNSSDFEFISEGEASKAGINNEKCVNSDSEDGYNSSDFEFISEGEASKAGINEEKCVNSDCEDGYNSSDFEFISEGEASKAGIITKSNKNTNDASINNNSVNDNVKIPNRSMFENKTGIVYSRKNEASLSDYIKYSKYRFQRCYSRNSNMTHENHAIPEGEQYLDMFRGANAPIVMNNLYTMRNKSIMPPVLMAVNYEDLMLCVSEADEHCEEHKDDAKESLNKILATYPHENRRKRRRRH